MADDNHSHSERLVAAKVSPAVVDPYAGCVVLQACSSFSKLVTGTAYNIRVVPLPSLQAAFQVLTQALTKAVVAGVLLVYVHLHGVRRPLLQSVF